MQTHATTAYRFKPATKATAKLRAALFGPSGSGKTFSALRIAAGLGGDVAVIDTERGSASKYADRFAFDVLELADKTIAAYEAAIQAAAQAGYPVLIIDSLSHGWQELLAEVDRLASAKYKGNTWSAWSEGTPKQRALVDAILSFPGHLIATMRSKTEWSAEPGRDGKTRPVRIGLAPEQGKGIEYEFDLLLELSADHVANIIKDRSGRFQDSLLDKPGEDFGIELAAWLGEAAAPEPKLSLVGRRAAPVVPPAATADQGVHAVSAAPQPTAAQPSGRPRRSDPPARRHGSGAPRQSPARAGGPSISEAQHRRLEARIAELKLDRSRVKAWVHTAWGVGSLNEVPKERYEDLDRRLDLWAQQQRENAERTLTARTNALDTAKRWGWNEDLAALPAIIEKMQKNAKSLRQSAQYAERGYGDEMQEAAQLDAAARLLEQILGEREGAAEREAIQAE